MPVYFSLKGSEIGAAHLRKVIIFFSFRFDSQTLIIIIDCNKYIYKFFVYIGPFNKPELPLRATDAEAK